MLRRLRWQLTGAYLLAALAIVAFVGAGTYLIVQNYFQGTIDLSLQHRMAIQFHLYGVALPESLVSAEEAWYQQQLNLITDKPQFQAQFNQSFQNWFEHENEEGYEEEIFEHAFESDLIALFVLPLNASGELLFNPNPFPLPMSPNVESSQKALELGYDWATTQLPSGDRVRILSYRTGVATAPAVFQVGQLLTSRDRIMKNLLFGILITGGVSMAVFGFISWWLAGKTLVPAQKAWDNQQSFVANASHELRAPLSLMRASVEVAQRSQLPEKASALLDDVIEECDYMNYLVEDLLLLSRLDAGHLVLEKSPIAVDHLIEDVARNGKPLAEKQRIELHIHSEPVQITGDPKRLRQVLLILLDNAFQHTPAGGEISLEAILAGKEVVISVQDTGAGIPPEHLPRIFERFYQVEAATRSETRSNGLGLSIAKALVENHAGSIRVESELGKGSRFVISLPVIDK
jgi:signal transduction histidine kinase